MAEKRIYFFGGGRAEGSSVLTPSLGIKGAGLAEMTRLGVPVPPGFTVTTATCRAVLAENAMPDGLAAELRVAVSRLEEVSGRSFGHGANPLLVSVRAGSSVAMPGTLKTVLNVGFNDETVEGLAHTTGAPKVIWNTYRRFVERFGTQVFGIDEYYFEEEVLRVARAHAMVRRDDELTVEQQREVIPALKLVCEKRSGVPFPDDAHEQLSAALVSVFQSWQSPAAVNLRRKKGISDELFTAANVQAMVFGNLGDDCATGIARTRDPETGENVTCGIYLPNAQGESLDALERSPLPLAGEDADSLEVRMPAAFDHLFRIQVLLESHYRSMQELEFTVERGKVWILQTRAARPRLAAAIQIAVDMVDEGLIRVEEALRRVPPEGIEQLLHPQLAPGVAAAPLDRGLAAYVGAASGVIALSADEAERYANLGMRTILVTRETTPEDMRGMAVAAGIVTANGGTTSHAAIFSRQNRVPCVIGCRSLRIDLLRGEVCFGDVTLGAGATITLDGATASVFAGELPIVPPALPSNFPRLMEWADERRRVQVRANADSGPGASLGRELGAEGVGLVRTEHMFFQADRITTMREMIVARGPDARQKALNALRPHQVSDFVDIFTAMDGLPVTVRLLDPPLHEFLPDSDEQLEKLGEKLDCSAREIRRITDSIRESNPMLGHRGCRLGVTAPQIYQMQVVAIFEAAARRHAAGGDVQVEILVPLVSDPAEMKAIRELIEAAWTPFGESGALPALPPIGAMIELPRACLLAGAIAKYADFISFGTNDLTQTVFGISRDDAWSFLAAYVADGVLASNPFRVLDRSGVGAMMEMACKRARHVRPGIKIGICGEHAGEPTSIAWLQRGIVDYVSCSPYRVPIARLAAARAAIDDEAHGVTGH